MDPIGVTGFDATLVASPRATKPLQRAALGAAPRLLYACVSYPPIPAACPPPGPASFAHPRRWRRLSLAIASCYPRRG